MDLIPRPDQVVAAAGNVAHRLLHGSVADLRPWPRLLIDDGPLREVYRYLPQDEAEDSPGSPAAGPADPVREPVLLVTPPSVPSYCYDLRRTCSLVEHLVGTGRPTYLVEYGEVSVTDRALTLQPWIDDVLPAAVRAASENAGGRPVHVVGWSLGGLLGLLLAASETDLPIASVVSLGVPVELDQVPMVAPAQPLLEPPAQLGALARLQRSAGLRVPPLLRWALDLELVQQLVTTPLALARNADDREFLAQVEGVGRFSDAIEGYPGRAFGQLYHRFVPGAGLLEGSARVGDREIDLAAVRQPVLVVAGATDTIAPVGAVRAVMPMLTGSAQTRLEIVPGGHLGLLTGRGARETTWAALTEWMATVGAGPARRTPAKRTGARKTAATKSTAKKAPAKKATTTKSTAKKSPAKKTAAKKSTAKKTATTSAARKAPARKSTAGGAPAKKRAQGADPERIGSNASRRYSSSGSRSLAR